MPRSRYHVSAHALDVLLKLEAEQLAIALPTYFRIDVPAIVRPFPIELPILDLHIERLDNVFETIDTSLVHLEHQSDYDPEVVPRCLVYDSALVRAYLRRVRTIIFYGPRVRHAPDRLAFSWYPYRVRNVYLGRRDGERAYRRLHRQLTAGTPLQTRDRLDLIFQPLMRQRRQPEQVVRDAVGLAARLAEPEQTRVVGALLAMTYHLLGESTLDRLLEEIMATGTMRKLFEQSLEQGLAQGLEQGELQARRHDVLRVLARRFGAAPAEVAARVEQIADTARLEALLDAAVDAPTLEAFSALLAPGETTA